MQIKSKNIIYFTIHIQFFCIKKPYELKGEIHMKVFLFNEEIYLVKLNKITIYIDNEVFTFFR